MKSWQILIISVTISVCSGSPIRNRQYPSENQHTSKLDLKSSENTIVLYTNETLFEQSAQPKPKADRGSRQQIIKDKGNYYIVVVSIPETTTSPPQTDSNAIIISEEQLAQTSENVNRVSSTSPPVEVQTSTPFPSLINKIGSILVHSIRGNVSGVVDESFGSGSSTPLVNIINNLLGDPSCNTLRRLLGQCGYDRPTTAQPSQQTEDTEDTQRALYVNVTGLII